MRPHACSPSLGDMWSTFPFTLPLVPPRGRCACSSSATLAPPRVRQQRRRPRRRVVAASSAVAAPKNHPASPLSLPTSPPHYSDRSPRWVLPPYLPASPRISPYLPHLPVSLPFSRPPPSVAPQLRLKPSKSPLVADLAGRIDEILTPCLSDPDPAVRRAAAQSVCVTAELLGGSYSARFACPPHHTSLGATSHALLTIPPWLPPRMPSSPYLPWLVLCQVRRRCSEAPQGQGDTGGGQVWILARPWMACPGQHRPRWHAAIRMRCPPQATHRHPW